jgi:hypothetical protein
MGPKEVALRIFITLKKSIGFGRDLTREPWVQWKAR